MTRVLPKPIFLSSGQSLKLSELLKHEFGINSTSISTVWLYERSTDWLKQNNFSYWQPNNPFLDHWIANGTQITPDQTSKSYNIAVDSISYSRGNNIGPFNSLYFFGEWYQVNVVERNVSSDVAQLGINCPTAKDIVETARKFASYYLSPPNNNDCHQIAKEVAAAAGAVLPINSGSLDPTQNQDGGFWRIAYRGSDNTAIPNWQSLVKPGDIVRMGWASTGNPHTTTILSVDNLAGTVEVYDNGLYINSISSIGIHTRNIDLKTIAQDITIYRLTTDNYFLTYANKENQTYLGSDYNDLFVSSAKNNSFIAGNGLDYVNFSGSSSTFTISTATNGVVTVSSPTIGVDTLTSVERVRFSDKVVAFDSVGTAGQAFRMYKAALDRTPDERGLAGWIKYMDEGGALTNVAQQFIDSQEFRNSYGSLDNKKFVNQLYLNVLDRNGEPTGINGWVNGLANGLSRADVLKGFSESGENKANVAGLIGNGISYTEWWI